MRTTLPWAGLILLAACSGGGEDKAAPANETATNEATANATAPDGAETATPEGPAEAPPKTASVTLTPGEWEISTQVAEMNIPGLPAGVLPKQVTQKRAMKTCLRPEEAGKPDADFFSGEKNPKCTYEGFEMTAGTVNGTITCPSRDGTQKMTMAGRYEPESYDLSMDMASQRMNMKMRVSGKRIGDCPG